MKKPSARFIYLFSQLNLDSSKQKKKILELTTGKKNAQPASIFYYHSALELYSCHHRRDFSSTELFRFSTRTPFSTFRKYQQK